MIHPELQRLENAISDYVGSTHFMFLDDSLKEQAEPLLHHWVRELGGGSGNTGRGTGANLGTGSPAPADLARAREGMARLELPVPIRRAIPHLLEEFLEYLAQTGLHPAASNWAQQVRGLAPAYSARIREDGSLKGETFRKNYAEVDRNAPCPCGSGKKFKKCCLPLIG
jgi:hypothetical protein